MAFKMDDRTVINIFIVSLFYVPAECVLDVSFSKPDSLGRGNRVCDDGCVGNSDGGSVHLSEETPSAFIGTRYRYAGKEM